MNYKRQHRRHLCYVVILCNVVTAVGSQSAKGRIGLAILPCMEYDHSQQLAPVLDLPARHGLIVKLKALEVNDQGVRQALDAAALHSIHLSTTNAALHMHCKNIHETQASTGAWSQDICSKLKGSIVRFNRANALVVCLACTYLKQAPAIAQVRCCCDMQVVQGHSVAHLFASFFTKVLVVSLHELPLHV